ncbi:MAG TPA: tripartite tricarboxylate transporter substrate binding protein [Burkholderiales bacterium]|jgi:tripartite-type tricarboxylate transporter receptor subunit TctC
MNHDLKPLRRLCGALAACALFAGGAAQAAYPDKPIKMLVAFVPGGGTDVVARLMSKSLTQRFNQSVYVENHGGAGGNLGTDIAVHSTPDGYTLLMGNIAPNAINVSIYKNLSYDPARDLAPITLVAMTPNMLVVNPSLPVNSVKELIALAKSRPNKLDYPSAGRGTSSHLAGELFDAMAGVHMTHVPYKGGGAAMADTLSGQVQVFFATMPAAIGHVKAGKLRALAVTSEKRSLALPDLPTIGETLPGYSAITWYGLYAPRNTPRDIIDRLNREITQIVNEPAMRAQMIALGFEPQPNTPEEFGAFIKEEIVKWGKVAKTAGIEPE